jgi:hypothetical protein
MGGGWGLHAVERCEEVGGQRGAHEWVIWERQWFLVAGFQGGACSTFPHTVFMVAGTQVGWVGVEGGLQMQVRGVQEKWQPELCRASI